METQTDTLNTKLSAIDKALAAAKARKAAKADSIEETAASLETPKVKIKKTDADRAQKALEREARQIELKSQREARKAAKEKEKQAKPAHMKKIDRAAGKLPALNDQLQLLFNEATTNFGAAQLTALALHLQHFNRVKATERALGQKLESGVSVRIIGGDPKFIGMTGTVSKAQRIRCYVEVSGVNKPVYLFTSDVELLDSSSTATGTDG